MAAKNLIPKSRAKTAYGLLSEVRALILAEPKRYDQTTFCTEGTERDVRPKCGTVCCVAGWIATLKGLQCDPYEMDEMGARVLGLPLMVAWELFDSDAAGDPSDVTAHARRGAAHIASFQEEHAAVLKAKRV